MWAHPGCLGQSGQCYLLIEISLNVFNYPVEAGSWKAFPPSCISWRSHSIAALKMDSKRTEQSISEEPATRNASFEVCFECAKNELNLRILHPPLSNKFHVAARVILGTRLSKYLRFEIKKDPFHRFGKRYRVLGAS